MNNAHDGQDWDLRRAEWKARQQAEREERAKRSDEKHLVSQELWAEQSVPPIPLLRDLNDWVIQHNEKRLPKWKFRFADDLAIQIHSKITRAHDRLFECVALQSDNVSAKLFLEPARLRRLSYRRLGFKLFAATPDATAWTFKATSGARSLDCPRAGLVELRQRVVSELHPDRFADLRPDLMLAPNCMCCGKGLTDPVSMARHIGPECWGSASTNLPHFFKTGAARDAA